MPTYDLPLTFDFDDPRVKTMIAKITEKKIRVTAAHVSQSRTLHFIAEWYASRYDGRFDFMRQMRDLILSDRDLSVNQMAGVINCLVHDASKRKPSKVEELPADLPAVTLPVIDHAEANADYPLDPIGARRFNEAITPIVKNGTYTVVLNESGDYRTLRVESAKNKPEGTQVVGFLSGPNNERDFTDFAWLSGQTIGVWPRYRGDSLSMTALEKLVYAGDDKRADYGMAYALESGRCYRCGRTLTVSASIHRGLGPDCAKRS